MSNLPKFCIDLLFQLLNPNPKQRPSAEQALSHPWFVEHQPAIQKLIEFNKNPHLVQPFLEFIEAAAAVVAASHQLLPQFPLESKKHSTGNDDLMMSPN